MHKRSTGIAVTSRRVILTSCALAALWLFGPVGRIYAQAQPPVILPALYIVGDSTAAKSNSPTIQGWGEPFLTYFDRTKINVVNAARGGRSSRTYITEGLLDQLVTKLHPGDDVLIQWGHNDSYELNDANGRGSLHGLGEETMDVARPNGKPETLHTFGWYMRKQIADIRAKGANPIVLTLTIRDRWNKDGTIERLPLPNIDFANTNRFHEPPIYSIWSAEVAEAAGLPLLDVHNMIADRYDKEGKDVVSTYFNNAGDPTHRNPKGAAVDAEITLAVLKAYKGPAYDQFLSDKGKAVAAADAKFIVINAAPATAPATGPAETQAADRVPLWNGKDLAGWRIFLGDPTVDKAKVWTATDGVLHLDTKISGYVATEKSYSNYHLHVEWRWPKDAPANTNSGVLVHLHGPDAIWPLCFECQLKSGNAGQIVGTGLDIPDAPLVNNRKRAPRFAETTEKPLGEWNAYDIYARDDTLELFVNDIRSNKVGKLPAKEGTIALQLEGFPVEFRTIWLEPLKPAATMPGK